MNHVSKAEGFVRWRVKDDGDLEEAAARSKDAITPGIATRSKNATRNKCIATRNKVPY